MDPERRLEGVALRPKDRLRGCQQASVRPEGSDQHRVFLESLHEAGNVSGHPGTSGLLAQHLGLEISARATRLRTGAAASGNVI